MDFTYFESLGVFVEQTVCLKRLRTAVFESSELLFLLRLNGRVSTIPTYIRETTDSLITHKN